MGHSYRLRGFAARAAASSGVALNHPLRPLALLAVVAALAAPTGTASGQCVSGTPETPPILPDANKTLLVVEARAEYILLPDTLWPYHRPPRGQVVAVEELEGPGHAELAPDSLAVIVQWRGGDEMWGCSPYPTRDSFPPGSRHLLRVELRPDTLWLEGRPTFDLHPGIYTAYTRYGRGSDLPSLATYRALLDTLPSREAWVADCRPGVARVKRWRDARPTSRRGWPFNRLIRDLEGYCLQSLKRHAREMERQEPRGPIPDELRELFVEKGCLDDSTTLMSFDDLVIDGHFVASEASQWAFTCPREGDWQLLVAILESSPRVIELLRMEGHEWNWWASAAAPEYLDWVCPRDVGSGRFEEPYPERDVVLLGELSIDDSMLAFYETPDGWVQVRTHYCDARMKGALDVREQQE